MSRQPPEIEAIEDSPDAEDEVLEDGNNPEAIKSGFIMRKRLEGRRLDSYLRARYPRLSRTTIQKLIKQGDITVNGLPTKPSYEPSPGDRVDVVLPPPQPYELIPEDIPLEVIYEDDYLLVINKHAGIICHPARSTQSGTVANGLAFRAASLSRGTAPYRPGIIHRLDKNTTGVMVVAKNDEAHWRLGLQFERRTVKKTYMGIVEGQPQLDADVIDQPLAAHPKIKDRYIVLGLISRDMLFKDAVTEYHVVERFKGFAVVHMHPRTGRTHQLRVHMSSIGHPFMGDSTYGGHFWSEKDLAGSGSETVLIQHQGLHAFRIEYVHPITEKRMVHEAPPPDNMQRILDLLRRHRSLS